MEINDIIEIARVSEEFASMVEDVDNAVHSSVSENDVQAAITKPFQQSDVDVMAHSILRAGIAPLDSHEKTIIDGDGFATIQTYDDSGAESERIEREFFFEINRGSRNGEKIYDELEFIIQFD